MDNSPEQLKNPKNKENSPEDVLYAIHQEADSGTDTKRWYLRNSDSGELIPIDTREDEEGTTREILPDDTLGREVVQDPHDDPDRVKLLYKDGFITAAETNAPTEDKISTQPIALNTETSPNTLGTNQKYANANASENATIGKAIKESTLETSSAPPSEFSSEVVKYKASVEEALNDITASLMSKADSLSGLGMSDSATLYAQKASELHDIINNEILSARDDMSALTAIHAKYFEGADSPSMFSKISPLLSANSSPAQFKDILSQTTTIPEITYLADSLLSARANLKEQKLAELKNASTSEEAEAIQTELEEIEAPADATEETATSEDEVPTA